MGRRERQRKEGEIGGGTKKEDREAERKRKEGGRGGGRIKERRGKGEQKKEGGRGLEAKGGKTKKSGMERWRRGCK